MYVFEARKTKFNLGYGGKILFSVFESKSCKLRIGFEEVSSNGLARFPILRIESLRKKIRLETNVK